MQIPLEKIDQLRERAGIGYREAKQILEQADGDLLEALIYLEGSPPWGGPLSLRLEPGYLRAALPFCCRAAPGQVSGYGER